MKKILYLNQLGKIFILTLFFFGVWYNIHYADSIEKRTIKVGVYDNPPAVFKDGDKIRGYYPEIFEAIADEIGVKYEYIWGTWDEIYQNLITGKIDMIYDIARTQERETLLDFNNETILISWGILYSREGLSISSLFDLEGKRIAVVNDDVYYEGHLDSLRELLEALNIKCEFIELGGFSEVVRAVENKNADVCALSRIFADYKLKSSKLNRTPIIFKPVHLHIAFPKGSNIGKELIPQIDIALARMKANSTSKYYSVIDSYFTNYTVVHNVPNWIWQVGIGIIVGVIILFVVIHNIILREQIRKRTDELEKANKLLYELSSCDPLTGLANRRIFIEKLEYEIARAKRYNTKLSLVMLDIDHFKNINDTFGHIVGDKILVRISSLIKKNIRMVDLVARYGGEEFGIILPETSLEDGFHTAEKIRNIIESENFDSIAPNLKITLTGGVAEWSLDFAEINDFINAVDSALYLGKDKGRNRVEKYLGFPLLRKTI